MNLSHRRARRLSALLLLSLALGACSNNPASAKANHVKDSSSAQDTISEEKPASSEKTADIETTLAASSNTSADAAIPNNNPYSGKELTNNQSSVKSRSPFNISAFYCDSLSNQNVNRNYTYSGPAITGAIKQNFDQLMNYMGTISMCPKPSDLSTYIDEGFYEEAAYRLSDYLQQLIDETGTDPFYILDGEIYETISGEERYIYVEPASKIAASWRKGPEDESFYYVAILDYYSPDRLSLSLTKYGTGQTTATGARVDMIDRDNFAIYVGEEIVDEEIENMTPHAFHGDVMTLLVADGEEWYGTAVFQNGYPQNQGLMYSNEYWLTEDHSIVADPSFFDEQKRVFC